MNTTEPFVSLFAICGDAGAATLRRMLDSIAIRPDGPMVDEIVIGWNGTDKAANLTAALGLELPTVEGELRDYGNGFIWPSAGSYNPPLRMKILRQTWKKDFALARNEVMAHCTGEWILWADADDIVASVTRPEGLAAINAVERDYKLPITPPPANGKVGGGRTLKAWLRTLPYDVNCVLAPYDYIIDAQGIVRVRQTIRRVLRRSAQWIWRSYNGVHELPWPSGVMGERSIYNGGLLNRHLPAQSADERMDRNAEIIKAMEGDEKAVVYADARHAYDLCTVYLRTGDLAKAGRWIQEAVNKSLNAPEDQFTYRIVLHSILGRVGNHAAATTEALRCIGLYPDRQEGYFAASESFFLQGLHAACVRYFEMGMACQVSPKSIDLPVNRTVNPRANAAISYCELGNTATGLHVAQEALDAYPSDALAQRAHARASADHGRKRAIDGLLDGAEYLLAHNDVRSASSILHVIGREAVPLRAASAGARYRGLDGLTIHKASLKTPELTLTEEARRVIEAEATRYPGSTIRSYNTNDGPPVDAEEIARDEVRRLKSVGEIQLLGLFEVPGGVVAITRKTAKPRITFYAPSACFIWNPTHPDTRGLGGSESAVVYLAREMARRGHPVHLYCPGGQTVGRVHMGVTWYGLNVFDPGSADHGLLIACRAPWVVRNPEVKVPVYAWHQDNGYSNQWCWSSEVDALTSGSLHVSAWARDSLMQELVGAPGTRQPQAVIGNGVCEDWVWGLLPADRRPARHPRRIIYASDPMRGLGAILALWPRVLEAYPDAELHVYSDFTYAHATARLTSETLNAIDAMLNQLRAHKGIFFPGWVAQPALSRAMFEASVYAYPGGSMPEGFGIVLAQAEAAGLVVVGPPAGALPEVLADHRYLTTERVLDEPSLAIFGDRLLEALAHPLEESDRQRISLQAWARHGWDKVADRFQQATSGGES